VSPKDCTLFSPPSTLCLLSQAFSINTFIFKNILQENSENSKLKIKIFIFIQKNLPTLADLG
jgi:hypothetical protein